MRQPCRTPTDDRNMFPLVSLTTSARTVKKKSCIAVHLFI